MSKDLIIYATHCYVVTMYAMLPLAPCHIAAGCSWNGADKVAHHSNAYFVIGLCVVYLFNH